MTMDETQRDGFEPLDPAQLGGLSDAQRDAIARAIVAQGPSLIQQGKAARFVRFALAGGAIAAAAALLLMRETREPDSALPAVAVAPAPACAADAPITPVRSEDGGRISLAVGARLSALATLDSELSIVQVAPCNVHLKLTRGTLTLHARDLGGGALSVDTPHGQVQVTGTLFRVATAAYATTISVVEGRVVVQRDAFAPEAVNVGQTLTIGAGRVERGVLSQDEQQTLRGAFGAPSEPAPEAFEEGIVTDPAQVAEKSTARAGRPKPKQATRETPRLSATALLAQAESLWRSGDREAARQVFRAAAQDSGATGEAAWIRLARLELVAGSPTRALAALNARRARGRTSTLGAEATWLEVQALKQTGRDDEAVRVSNELLREYPSAPQAAAARRLVGGAASP